MRGDLQKIIYEKEEYEIKIKLYDVKDKDGEVVKTIYRTLTRKRVKLDYEGNPIIKKEIWFKPYDLDKRYPDIKRSDGTIIYGELMYPYIYVYK